MPYFEMFGTLLVPVSTTLSEVVTDTAGGAAFETVSAFAGYFEGLGDIQTYTAPSDGTYYVGAQVNIGVTGDIALSQLQLGMQWSGGSPGSFSLFEYTEPITNWSSGVPSGAQGEISLSIGSLFKLTAGDLLFPVVSDVIGDGSNYAWQGYPGSTFFVFSVDPDSPQIAFSAISASP
jgi:hypothetical protein